MKLHLMQRLLMNDYILFKNQVPKTLFILFIHLPAFKQPQQPI